MGEDFCLVDSAKTLTILKDEKYFQQLSKVYVNTISGSFTKLKVLKEQILCYQKEQKFALMILCTLLNLEEI